MNATPGKSIPTRPAHILFPADQALLWLPGFSGDEAPYCSYNEYRSDPTHDRRRFDWLPECDQNGARYIPPYPVSSETYITWRTNVSPPYPYHPVPLARSLSHEELTDLGREVLELIEEDPGAYPEPAKVLRNEFKPYILAALARLGLLPDREQTLRPI